MKTLRFGSVGCGILTIAIMGYIAACGEDGTTEPDADACSVGQVLSPGEKCAVGGSSFEVSTLDNDPFACLIEPDGISQECANKDIAKGGFAASNIEDTLDWRIDSMP